eukprot:CAMPEP_0196129828 /NCGR_PEP_ID=MMETSP0910-20130528/414_1 /TAXON_ID=49265 /ORGANISM="Thalassiosira rotula, Strain GSO102" /LENGTH=647 /DNA_ID=CAMNT_0041389023 /DNA_START=267 /DNA_END=2210 /DNA_ORIENTATION=-
MITTKLSLLLAATAASVAHAETEITGYVMDKQCVYKYDCEPGVCEAPDGSNPFYGPEEHTPFCLQLLSCKRSGYTVMSTYPTEADGKHSLIANFTDDPSNKAMFNYIRKIEPSPRRATKMPMPLVSIIVADDSPIIDNITQISGDVIVKDPWPESAYNGSATTQTVCDSVFDASIEDNNLCFRSDVIVSMADFKEMFVIESNGCPDHGNMEGEPGNIENSQEWPMAPEEETPASGDNPSGAIPAALSFSCSDLKQKLVFDPKATLHYKIGDGVLHGCLEVENDGWIGFGVSAPNATSGGFMFGADAIIGVPGDAKPVQKYDLTFSPALMPDAQQTLEDVDLVQDGDMMIMQFTKKLVEEGENSILEVGLNNFIHARGGSTLEYHGPESRFIVPKDFSEDPAGGSGRRTQSGGSTNSETFEAMYHHYTMMIPQVPGAPGDATPITDNIVGMMTNGVLLDSHSQTWAYDMCNGYSDKKRQYHYQIPPICYLKSMGVPTPASDRWWINDDGTEVRPYSEMSAQFPKTGLSPVVGFARDGFPIYALYGPDGQMVRSAIYEGDLDECNGKGEGSDYAYYITAEPPFVPTCLRGTVGNFAFATSDKKCPGSGISNSISGVTPSDGDDESAAFAKVPLLSALISAALAAVVFFI